MKDLSHEEMLTFLELKEKIENPKIKRAIYKMLKGDKCN